MACKVNLKWCEGGGQGRHPWQEDLCEQRGVGIMSRVQQRVAERRYGDDGTQSTAESRNSGTAEESTSGRGPFPFSCCGCPPCWLQ